MKIRSKCDFKFMRFFATSLLLLAILGQSQSHAGSLWREAVSDPKGMFADKVARRVGDIVTIVVEESAVATNSLKIKTAKTSTNDANDGLASSLVNQFITGANESLKKKNSIMNKFPLSILPTPSGGLVLPKASAVGANTFDGGGDITDTQKLTASMAVQVVDRLPNGNLVIEGIRQVGFSKERQFASLRGIIRPYDISLNNSVSSTAVADARIDVVSEGQLTSSQKKGWLLRLDEKISPY